jgi:hypothetical protein
MTRFKVDDGMHDHPKFDETSDAAIALWTRAGSWSCRYLTDGFIPLARVARLRGTLQSAEELVRAGLWHRVRDGHRDGFLFHDWSQINDTKSDVESYRARDREDKKARRAKLKAKLKMSVSDSEHESLGESYVESRRGGERSSDLSDSEPGPANENSGRRDSDRKEPARLLMDLEIEIGAEYSRRRVGSQGAGRTQYLAGCKRVDEHVRDGHFPDVQSAIKALAKAAVGESIKPGGKPLGLALLQAPFAPAAVGGAKDVMALRRAAGVTYIPRADE